MVCKSTLLGAAVLSLALPASALNVPVSADQGEIIVVEGSRLNQTATEMGSSVSVITADELEELGVELALDALATVPGVSVNSNGAFGGVASVRIRGAASAQTLVLIDGVAVNDPTSPAGGFDFARLDTENIARIEVLKGPQSTLWGTDAMGGVVSIITKRPEAGAGGTLFAEYGSFDTFRGGASVENARDIGDFRVALVATTSEGISKADTANGNPEADGYRAFTLSAKGGLNLGAGARLGGDILWTDAVSDFDSFAFGAEGNIADGDEVSETGELSANVTLTGALLDGLLENLLLIGHSQIARENFTSRVPGFSAEGERTVFRYQGTLTMDPRNRLAFGAEREQSAANDDDTALDGLFALYEFKPVAGVTLTGGLRLDDHERFGSETTARGAVAYNPTDQVTLRASWGQGFKAPTIFQSIFFCCGASGPNTDLQAETSEAFDVGLDWRSPDGRAEAGITYFDQDIDNQIDFSFALGGYENIAQVESRGVELYGGYQWREWLRISADYAYIDAADGNGNRLTRLPEHTGHVTLTLDPSGPFSGAVLIRYNGEETNSDGTSLAGWTRIDLTGAYGLSERVELFGRIENLLNEDYQQVLGYGTPGLSGSLGVRYRFGRR